MHHEVSGKSAYHGPLVLVVDDECVIADTLAAILRQHGFTTRTAYDGKTALTLARVHHPSLLITDVVMPGMTGVDLAMATKKDVPGCAILLFSGQAATADLLARARQAGHNFTVISKPVHPTELLRTIGSLQLSCRAQDR